MIENDDDARLASFAGVLRESFARHEGEAPAPMTLRAGIDRLTTRRRRVRRGVLTGGTAVLVAAVLVAVPFAVRLVLPQNQVHTLPIILPGVLPPDRALNILVLGLDDAPGMPAPYRADSITLVHIPRDRSHVYLVDFERDVQVDIPGYGTDRINQAYADGGATLTAQVVYNLTNVPIDGIVVVTLEALSSLVDALGPVHVCLPDGFTSIHTGQTFPAGCQDLDGTEAVTVARARQVYDPSLPSDTPHGLPMGGYERDGNVQRIMMGLVARAASLNLFTDAGKITSLLSIDGLTMDTGSLDPAALAAQLHGMTASDLTGIVSPKIQRGDIVNGQPLQALDPVVTPELFADLRADTLGDFAAAHPDWLVNSEV